MKTLLALVCGTLFVCCRSNPDYMNTYGDARYAPLQPGSSNNRNTGPSKAYSVVRNSEAQRRSDVVIVGVHDTYSGGTSTQQLGSNTLLKQEARSFTSSTDQTALPRLVAYTATLSLAVDSIDTVSHHIAKLCSTYGGYVVSSTNQSIAIRVNASSFEAVLRDIAREGQLEHKITNAVDVSEQYYDLETRLSTAESARKRYVELLAKAENVDAALKVERELERITESIESMKAQRDRLREQYTLSEIYVNLRELNPKNQSRPGPLGYLALGVYKAIEWLFVWY